MKKLLFACLAPVTMAGCKNNHANYLKPEPVKDLLAWVLGSTNRKLDKR